MKPSDRTGGNRFIVSYANRQVVNALTVSGANALSRAVEQAGAQAPTYMRELARTLDLKAIPKTKLEKANLELAESAQAAMVNGWRSRLPSKAPGYRPQGVARDPWGRLVGRLGPALASPRMTEATTANTISFVNGGYLTDAAEHWWRVNYGSYGAGGLRGRRAGQYVVKGDGVALMTLRDRAKPSPANWLPRRYTATENSYFSPLPTRNPEDKQRMSRGIRPARFTDLGLKTIAKEFYPKYVNVFDEFVDDRNNRVRLQKFNINVDVRLGRARG